MDIQCVIESVFLLPKSNPLQLKMNVSSTWWLGKVLNISCLHEVIYVQGLAPFTRKRCPAKFIEFWWVVKEWTQKFWGYHEIDTVGENYGKWMKLNGWILNIFVRLANLISFLKSPSFFFCNKSYPKFPNLLKFIWWQFSNIIKVKLCFFSQTLSFNTVMFHT